MYQFVFDQALSGTGESRRFFRKVRRWLLRWTDPVVSWELNGRKLRLNLSHQLPFYRQEFPTYSANLQRLATALRKRHKQLVMIDVGANIGDSVAQAGLQPGDACLLVEGNPAFFDLLQANTSDLPEALCVLAMLSDKTQAVPGQLVAKDGTGQVVSAQSGTQRLCLEALDSLVAERPRFQAAHLLKIDVDGYDFRVLRGAAQLVRNARPVLFFEQDPVLLEGAGESPDAVWNWLAEAGYERVLLYDNFGWWLGAFALAEPALLNALNFYARQRPGSYYDVAALADSHDWQEAFLDSERQFYRRLSEAR